MAEQETRGQRESRRRREAARRRRERQLRIRMTIFAVFVILAGAIAFTALRIHLRNVKEQEAAAAASRQIAEEQAAAEASRRAADEAAAAEASRKAAEEAAAAEASRKAAEEAAAAEASRKAAEEEAAAEASRKAAEEAAAAEASRISHHGLQLCQPRLRGDPLSAPSGRGEESGCSEMPAFPAPGESRGLDRKRRSERKRSETRGSCLKGNFPIFCTPKRNGIFIGNSLLRRKKIHLCP